MTRQHFSGRKVLAAALAFALFAGSALAAERVVTVAIDRTRGADAAVDYTKLTNHGPWDDRNYRLTARDIALLGKDDQKLDDPIPAFFRVELRKKMKGPIVHYPMSALNIYLQQYGGYQIDGKVHRRIRALGGNRFQVLENDEDNRPAARAIPLKYASGERRVTTPNGAAESAVAVNPANPQIVIAGTNGPGGGQKMWRSADGGQTWLSSGALSDVCCDPTVAWSPDGTVGYTSSLSFNNTAGSIRFYRSTDNGATWTKTANLSTVYGADKEFIHVDTHPTSPYLGRVYESWHEGNIQQFSRSSDNGLTFSTKMVLDNSNRGIGSDITTDTAGNVYFFYATFDTSTFPKQIRMVKSTNGGVSFGTGVTVGNNNGSFNFAIPAFDTRKVPIIVSADSDRTGGTYNNTIYATWTDNNNATSSTIANNHAVVKVARSRDGGATWQISNPHPTSDVATVDRFNPWLSVDNQGRVHVIYYDTRHSVGRTGTDLYHSVSTDGGVTWASRRLTTVTSANNTDSFEWGDYNGLDVIGRDIIAIYTDNRDEAGGTAQSKDVYTIGFDTGGGGTNVAPTANFTTATSGLTATFTDTSTDSDGTIASRSWNFGDGTTSTATNPSKTYAAAGTYPVALTVTDNGGLTNTKTQSVTVTSGGGVSQLLLNPGFESGNVSWTASTGVITNSTARTPRTGTWYARMGGKGVTTTQTMTQAVAIPSGKTSATLSFYLKIDTAETTTTTQYDKLVVEVRNSAGTVLKTCATYSNLNKGTSYVQRTCDLTPYIGQTVTVRFNMTEDSSLQTSFVIDDTALNVQ
jgi:PKD repeat protein